MNKLKEIAKNAVCLSPLMEGRKKITTEDIIKNYDGEIIITEVDMIGGGESSYPVMTVAEDGDAFYCGGIVLKKIVNAWIDYCGSIDDVNKMLEKDPVKVRLEEAKTKDGKNNITKITIV